MRLTCLLLSLALASCAPLGPTAYQPASAFPRGGYSEAELQPGIWRISFEGNAATSKDRASDFAMLRAAEICLSQGASYMEIAGAQSSDQPLGSSVDGTGFVASRPSSSVVVGCQQSSTDGSWDVAFLANSLRSKYGLNE